MKWIKSASGSAYQDYVLQDNEKTLLSLRYNSHTGTLRLKAGNIKRLLMLDTLQPAKIKIGFLNEYGITVGGLSFTDGKANSGTIRMNEYSYHYILSAAEGAAIRIYDSADNKLRVHGVLSPLQGMGIININNEQCFANEMYTPLVAGLLWYISINEISPAAAM